MGGVLKTQLENPYQRRVDREGERRTTLSRERKHEHQYSCIQNRRESLKAKNGEINLMICGGMQVNENECMIVRDSDSSVTSLCAGRWMSRPKGFSKGRGDRSEVTMEDDSNCPVEEQVPKLLSVELVKCCYGDRGIAGSALVRLRSIQMRCFILREVFGGGVSSFDTFPSWLESLQELRVLVLRANRFNGTINCFQSKNDTFSKLTGFDISNNKFRGNLPYIRPTDYRYNDSIEVTMKGNTFEIERILTTLTIVDLSNNRFEGTIPTIIGELKSLIGLNLSNNRITGFIPQNLSGLEKLEWLDLSSNMLTGEKGVKDLETFHNDEQFCFGWKVVAIGYGCGVVFGMVLGYLIFFIQKTGMVNPFG
ncbi:hypothetical protein V8G54_037073 [Vigna mungo]|uniref:Uncharacterized protein n=1 Tax=Vigna mungo TaxID=3915 RepID=A0AAQ3MJM1_VIGMU